MAGMSFKARIIYQERLFCAPGLPLVSRSNFGALPKLTDAISGGFAGSNWRGGCAMFSPRLCSLSMRSRRLKRAGFSDVRA